MSLVQTSSGEVVLRMGQGGVVTAAPKFAGSRGGHASQRTSFHPRLPSEPILATVGDVSAQAAAIRDLSNLLAVALGNLEQLYGQPLSARGNRQLDRARWGVLQAGYLARQVLASAYVEGTMPKVVDLNEAVSMFKVMMAQVAMQRVRLAVEITPVYLPARLNAERLQRALLNLVRNAAEAMQDGGSVVIRTTRHAVDGLDGQPTVEISVSNAGAFSVTRSEKDVADYRLWMVQRFAAESGGKVEIETDAGQGTTVRLIFPHGRAESGCR